MSENDYECPKCHNIFPKSNKFMHDIRCTEKNPVPLNASRLCYLNDNKKDNNNKKQTTQHLPQPKITSKRKPDSHINPLNMKESVLEIPETFNCWLCGATLPEKEREDHMLCHQMEEENEKSKKRQGNQQNNSKQIQNERPPQRQFRPPHQPTMEQPRNREQKNNNNINIKRSFIPFEDIDIFDFNQIHESLNRMKNPTDQEIMNELPETEIGDISKLDPEKRNCIICLTDLKKGDKATMLPCIHMFHSTCIQDWLKTTNECPVCKMKLTKELLNY